MKKPRTKLHDLSTLIIGAKIEGPKPGRNVPQVKVPTKQRYKGLCPTCGGSKVIDSPVPGVTWLCPYCTGYQKCGL